MSDGPGPVLPDDRPFAAASPGGCLIAMILIAVAMVGAVIVIVWALRRLV